MTKPNPFAHLAASFAKAPPKSVGGSDRAPPQAAPTTPKVEVYTPEEQLRDYAAGDTRLTMALDKALSAEPTTPKAEVKNISESPKPDLTIPSASANTDEDVGKALEAMKAMTQTFLTPQAQQLLTAGPVEQKEEFGVEGGNAVVVSDLNELAHMDTETLEPQTRRESNLNVQAKEFGQRLVLEQADSVRGLCDTIDRMIEGNDSLAGPALIQTRNYVQQLMITLKARPEFDSVIIDKDVRNVLKFIRATRLETLEMREIKTEKKAVRAAKKEQKKDSTKGFAAAFNMIMGGGK